MHEFWGVDLDGYSPEYSVSCAHAQSYCYATTHLSDCMQYRVAVEYIPRRCFHLDGGVTNSLQRILLKLAQAVQGRHFLRPEITSPCQYGFLLGSRESHVSGTEENVGFHHLHSDRHM